MSDQSLKFQPRVSILLSAYNSEQFIQPCVRSLLDQTFEDFELLVVDDGSTDRTWEILKSFNDPRLKVARQDNMGLTVTLNVLLAQAKGVYIGRQDADDYSLPERIEKEVRFLDSHADIALVGTWSVQIDDDNEEIYRFEPEARPEALNQLLVEQNPFIHGSWLVRREALLQLGGYREEFRCSQDYDLLLRMKENYRVSNIPEVLYAKRHTSGMVSVRNVSRQSYFGELARKCWRERADFGIDHIQKGLFEAPVFNVSDESKTGMILYHKHLISVFARKGEAAKIRAEIYKLLRISRFDPFAYMQYLLSFGGNRVLRMTSRLWDSLRRE